MALHARDEAHLVELAGELERAALPHACVREQDGTLQAIGLEPTTDRKAIRKVVSSLPLVR